MVEQRVSETILEKPVTVNIAGKTFNVARPTLATLIEVSRISGKFPAVNFKEDGDILRFVLANAGKYGDLIAEVAAVLIAGAQKKKTKRWFWQRKKDGELKEWLTNNASSEDLCNVISVALTHQKIGFFLRTFISLSDTNVTKATKETEATASGE